MYIVKKTISGKDYYYLRKSVREGNKVKSVSVAYLGKTKEEAEKKAEEYKNQPKDLNNKKSQNKIMETKKDEKVETNETKTPITIEELANFCKAKGFVFRSSDVYGGFSGFWDFGPLGVELLNNIKKSWWDYFVKGKDNMVGMEASIIGHPRTWKASGHLANFTDVSVQCKKCKKFNKVDKADLGKEKCAFCGGELDITTAKDLNLMLKTNIGPVEQDSVVAYLRPETAQGMFIDFKLIQQTSRMQLPFGIAQIGRCFRNEIAPRDFLFRSREFHIGEFEFFINPEEKKCDLLDEKHLKLKIRLLDSETQEKNETTLRQATIEDLLKEKRLEEWHAYWLAEQILWFNSIGLTEIKIREHKKGELSHYSSATFDLDYEYAFGSREVAGIANRGQFDLKQHEKESSISMEVFDEKYKNKVIPKVIEPTFGIERAFLAVLTKAYCYDKKRDYVTLKIPPKLAPIKAAVFPIVKEENYIKIAEDIVKDLQREFNVIYDKSGSIGRRYARNDETGTPFCITIDELSAKQNDVTIRLRDTTEQIRIKIKDLRDILRKAIEGEDIKKFGKMVETRVKE